MSSAAVGKKPASEYPETHTDSMSPSRSLVVSLVCAFSFLPFSYPQLQSTSIE